MVNRNLNSRPDNLKVKGSSRGCLLEIVCGKNHIPTFAISKQECTGQVNGIQRLNDRRHWHGCSTENQWRERHITEEAFNPRQFLMCFRNPGIIQRGFQTKPI